MPLSPDALKRAETLEQKCSKLIEEDPDREDYDFLSSSLSSLGLLINEAYSTNERQVDDEGKLTEEPVTRYPAKVDGKDPNKYGYFFEPNVREVQSFLRSNPQSLDRLGLRDWSSSVVEPERREDVADPTTGAVQGWNIVPAKTNLDLLTESNDPNHPYTITANEMWRLKMGEAQQRGEGLKRYRDVRLDKKDLPDYVAGGINKGMNRVVAPALMGAADAFTMGQAAPLGDAITDLADYELGRRGYNLEDYFGPQPRSQEVINRNMPAYIAGSFAGSGAPRNPTNALALGVTESALGRNLMKAARTPISELDNYSTAGRALDALPGPMDVPRRAAASALAGGIGNATEGFYGDLARSAQNVAPGDYSSVEDVPLVDFDGREMGNALATAAGNVPGNSLIGTVAGGGLDLAGQGIGSLRDTYRDLGRNSPLKTLEEAGGEADIIRGVSPTDEIKKAYIQAKANGLNPNMAPRTAAGQMAEDLAPSIDKSIRQRAVDEQAHTAQQMEEYYNHPDYRDRRISARPAVEGMVEMAQRGFTRGPDGSMVAMDPATIDQIGGVLRDYSGVTSHAKADAPRIAYDHGGTVVDGELANRLYGFSEDDPRFIKRGRDAVIRPIDITAQNLTTLEGRIDRELNFAAARGSNNDPVWTQFNRDVKGMRDKFPRFEDESGNLVAPPPESVRREPFSMDPGAVPAQEEMRVLNPPEQVRGGPQRKPEGLMGVGGPQPELPGTFDRRAGKQQGAPADMLPRPIGVGGEGMVAKPEGLYGVGSGGPPIPENPFDARLPTAQESLRPMMQKEVTGGEYGPPPPLDPRARMGVGDRFNPEPVRAFTKEGLPIPGQQTVGVQGSYNKPQRIEPDRAPTTERNPYGHVNRGQPEPEVPLPPSEPAEPRNPYGNGNKTSEESLSLLAGNKLAMEVEEPHVPTERVPREAQPAKQHAPVVDFGEIIANKLAAPPFPMSKGYRELISGLESIRGKGDLEDTALTVLGLARELNLRPNEKEYLEHVVGKSDLMDREVAREQRIAEDEFQMAILDDNARRARENGATEVEPIRGESMDQFKARGGKVGVKLPPEVQAAVDDGTLSTEAQQKAMRVEPSGKAFGILDKSDGAIREKTFATAEEARKEAARLNTKFKSQGRFKVKGVDVPQAAEAADTRGGLERMLDDQLDSPDAPRVPNTEIEEIGALQTADREQVSADQKAYVDELFSPGKEARAAQIDKIRSIAEHPEIVEEAIAAVKKVDERLGPIDQEQKRAMVVKMIENKLGRKIDVEDLIRFGLISAGLVQMGTSDDDDGVGASVAGIGMFGFGRGKKPEAEAPRVPKKPTEPTATLDDGTVVKGFSAMRSKQHTRQEAIERAIKRLGVEGDTTLEGRIRTYGQLDDRGKVDQALLDEATHANKARELRNAAGANAYDTLKDRALFGGNEGIAKATLDFLGFRGYRGSEYFAGRHTPETPRGEGGFARNPYVREPTTLLGDIQRTLLEDPARRLLDLTGGSAAARWGTEAYDKFLKSDSRHESKEEKDKKDKRKSASP